MTVKLETRRDGKILLDGQPAADVQFESYEYIVLKVPSYMLGGTKRGIEFQVFRRVEDITDSDDVLVEIEVEELLSFPQTRST